MVETIAASEIAGAPGTVVVGLLAGPMGGRGAEALRDALGVDILGLVSADPTFTGAEGQVLSALVSAPSPVAVRVVGLGAQERLSGHVLRRAAMAAGATDGTVTSLLALEGADAAALAATVEGHRLGAWRYGIDPGALRVVAVGDTTRAEAVAAATNWVRELVETPPNVLTPRVFAERIAAFAAESAPGVTVDIWDAATLEDRGFGATLGVGSAAAGTALVVELTVDGRPGAAVTALAGKGITFDSGGINLKRDPGEIGWMKSDMAAAAAVAAAVITAATLGTERAIHAVLPITENMPGSTAQRPGDVVTHPDGSTTEVSDTDSKGRLVLADALAWLAATGPAELIDVGTLTDSGSLGTEFWGCWGTSQALANALVAAGERSGDTGWSLPLHDSYGALLESRVADRMNAPKDAPDTGVVAATYLSSFVAGVPWVHIDNGSGAWLERDSGSWREGPTGTPVRALIEYLVTPRER